MDEKELREIFEQLEQQGWKPMLCDTPVPFYDNEVMCGHPNNVGDVVKEEQMIPRKMLTSLDDYAVRAKGDSMLYYKQQLQKVGANVVGGVCLGKTRHTERTTDELLEDFKEVLDLKEEEDCQAQLEREETSNAYIKKLQVDDEESTGASSRQNTYGS